MNIDLYVSEITQEGKLEYKYQYSVTSPINISCKTNLIITLHATKNFLIDQVHFPSGDQLSVTKQSETTVTITDIDTKSGEFYFSIDVKDTSNNKIINCDPQVKNVLKPPAQVC